ncbi:MAG: ABC transporter permease [Oscillospiraceae bacterium]|nr:ABC transporter permease [Oscillospiraceae bacterium]MDY3793015.1 ABC transporter permease [Oscillospiraceae bacterium]MDY6208115.1 ABC transporter permease [Oscillospiraceae bacterium]
MKLGNLLKKELKELLTPQAIFSMIFTCVLLIVMGNVMGGAMDEALNNSTVNIANLDSSEFTDEMIKKLPDYGADPTVVTLQSEDFESEMQRLDIKNLVIIPEGFGDSVTNGSEAAGVDCVSIVTGGGLTASMQNMSASSLTSSITNYVRDYIETEKMGMTEGEKTLLAEPVITVEYTTANGKTVQVSSDMLMGVLMSQSMIAPFAVFFLILMASQMIMTAISTEKIDKTLETLMSAPVSRITVLTAKMISAVIVALLNAGAMIIGFAFYMQGMMGGAAAELEEGAAANTAGITSGAEALASLGLTLGIGDILLFGVDLFLTIAIGLSVSLILGAMATDTKSVQTLVMPIMMATMIPFFVTLFADVNSMSPALKIIMYIIPFTHTYTAMNNLMFGETALVIGGLVYQAVFFAVCMYLAVKMFTSDLLFTMNFSADSGRKKSLLKGGAK